MEKQAGSSEMVRHINQKLVLDVIRKQEPISRAQISKQLHLSRSTVSQIVACLLTNNMVFEVGLPNGDVKTCGRPGQMLRFNPVSSYIVGMDLRGDSTAVCVADMRGKPLAITAYPPVRDAEQMYTILMQALDEAGIEKQRVARLSVSVPGVANAEGKVLRASRLRWRNYNLPSQFKQFCDIPIYVNNDVNLALIGERRFSIGYEHENLIYIHLGTGIGCGILSEGKLVLGSSFTAGEIQHCPYADENKKGYESLENTIGMNRFQQYPGGVPALVEGYSMGDPSCVPIIESFIHALAMTIAFIVNLLNPSLVILGGDMSTHIADLLDDIQSETERYTPYKADIQLAQLKSESCLLGAVAYALEQIDQE